MWSQCTAIMSYMYMSSSEIGLGHYTCCVHSCKYNPKYSPLLKHCDINKDDITPVPGGLPVIISTALGHPIFFKSISCMKSKKLGWTFGLVVKFFLLAVKVRYRLCQLYRRLES